MKNHNLEVQRILNDSSTPINDLGKYVNSETEKAVSKYNYGWSIITITLTVGIWITLFNNRPKKQIVLTRQVFDSIQNAFQCKLDKIVDSLTTYQYKPKTK